MHDSKYEEYETNGEVEKKVEQLAIVKQEKQKMPSYLKKAMAVTIISSMLLGGFGGYLVGFGSNGKASLSAGAVAYTDNASNVAQTMQVVGSNSLASMVAKAKQAVVAIDVEATNSNTAFGNETLKGSGSGVIISSDGYIITNNHVIQDTSSIKVYLASGKEYKAKLIGTDSKTDVALLKIDATNLTVLPQGDSSKLHEGDMAIAIGNPLGMLSGTVTSGIISGQDRAIVIDGKSMNLLQTDAAINPGNSGGALVDANGNLIGLVVAKSGGVNVEGLGFAIPVNDVKLVLNDLQKYGYVKGRPVMGISIVEVNDTITAQQYGVEKFGVYIANIAIGSGAEKAGLKAGDYISKIDGKVISSYADIDKVIKTKKVGETIIIGIERNGTAEDVNVTLQEQGKI
ncbi:MAG: trypsin-like peptidase domain-containing protein [Clostridia bacterium]